jgi:hypothetical protein
MEALPLPPEWNLGSHLQFGVEVKVGKDWDSMEKVPVPQPWLAMLKGRPDDPSAMLLDLGDRSVVDESEDPELVDDDYAPEDPYEFGGGRFYGGSAGGTGGADPSSDDIPF